MTRQIKKGDNKMESNYQTIQGRQYKIKPETGDLFLDELTNKYCEMRVFSNQPNYSHIRFNDKQGSQPIKVDAIQDSGNKHNNKTVWEYRIK